MSHEVAAPESLPGGATVIDGRAMADELREELAAQISRSGTRPPGLAKLSLKPNSKECAAPKHFSRSCSV